MSHIRSHPRAILSAVAIAAALLTSACADSTGPVHDHDSASVQPEAQQPKRAPEWKPRIFGAQAERPLFGQRLP